jgi:transglutaminase-like putative cysteine protease
MLKTVASRIADKLSLMRLRVGCEFAYEVVEPTPTIWQVRCRLDGEHQMVSERWTSTPLVPSRAYVDDYGNLCDRLVLPAGATTITYSALVDVPDRPDDVDKEANQVPVEVLPEDALVYLLASRFVLSDLLLDRAWELFGHARPGWERVQAVCDWTHQNLRYQIGSSTPLTTSSDVLDQGMGVCRDFTQVGMAFCRALNVPARYVSGYIPDIGVDPPDLPMDFCSWFEAYLDGRWWTFDPRNNVPRVGRVVVGRGRDAADVAMVTTYGPCDLRSMVVWADEAGAVEAADA